MECEDPKCPIHGSLKTHGGEIEGVVVSDRAAKTVIVERPYTTFLKKYERSLRKTSRIAAYNPACIGAKTGDRVVIAGTRKLSKTKAFVVTKVIARAVT
ncbi:MAG: 30S ribosomal protein S17 [Candidatus Marsarchaeota archaeon]|nr:30S ribosomal protein S17 [Candidatus Marsarchaeota archaeon]